MERKVPFVENEYYHLFSRGVEQRDIFHDDQDRERFLALLLCCNSTKNVKISNLSKRQRGEPLLGLLDKHDAADRIISVLAYALMPNHFHIVVRENSNGAISKFMLKLMTAYSMYFNTKYGRSGPLFTRPFRSRHVDSDEYFRWVFAYVTLNPLELHQTDWKRAGVKDLEAAQRFMKRYRYSSFSDYFFEERPEKKILDTSAVPFSASEFQTMDSLLCSLAEQDVSAAV